MICNALSAQGNRCARDLAHVGCHEVYVDGDGRRWWGDASPMKEANEREVEEAILRQSMACHSDRVTESDKRAKGRGKERITDA